MGTAARTYVIRSGRYTKIGKTTKVERRIKEYNTHNPSYEVLYISYSDVEKELHEALSKYRVKNEWFNIPPFILDQLLILLRTLDKHQIISIEDLPIKDKRIINRLTPLSSLIVISNKWVIKLALREPFRISYIA